MIEKWECEFLKEKKFSKDEMMKMKKKFYSFTPLEPRDVLYGGRTSQACLFKKVIENEKILYIDFTSLYPFVQTKKFPTGHPQIYIKDECEQIDIKNMFGLVKCKILPPSNLYFPVLPIRCEGKSLFPLCYTCASTTCLNNCTHNEDERCLIGTWATVEVNKAIEKGYCMCEIYEIYHFYRQEKVFSEYINCFLKIKQEASGFPTECYDNDDALVDEKVNKYIEDYYNNEGIRLDKENIKYNPGLRTIAKNILNSLWGKFAQNENNAKVDFFSEYDELLNLANDKNIELISVDFVNETITRVTYKKKESINIPLKTGNVIIASFVTAYARLKLFNLIDNPILLFIYVVKGTMLLKLEII